MRQKSFLSNKYFCIFEYIFSVAIYFSFFNTAFFNIFWHFIINNLNTATLGTEKKIIKQKWENMKIIYLLNITILFYFQYSHNFLEIMKSRYNSFAKVYVIRRRNFAYTNMFPWISRKFCEACCFWQLPKIHFVETLNFMTVLATMFRDYVVYVLCYWQILISVVLYISKEILLHEFIVLI